MEEWTVSKRKEVSGLPPVVGNELIQNTDTKVCDKPLFNELK